MNGDLTIGEYRVIFSPTARDQRQHLSFEMQGFVDDSMRSLVERTARTPLFFQLDSGRPTGIGVLLYAELAIRLAVSDHTIHVQAILLVRDPRNPF